MGRTLIGDPVLDEKLKDVEDSSSTGLVVGSVVEDKHYAVFLARTPVEEGDEETATPAPKSTGLDVSWMVEHAKQVLRLLPGGLTVIGVRIPSTLQLEEQEGKLRKLVNSVVSLDSSVPKELIILQDLTTVRVLDSKSNSFKSVDLKISPRSLDFVRVDTAVILDIPSALSESNNKLGEEVRQGVKVFTDSLLNCMFIFNNKIMKDKELLGKPVEVEKKRKGKNNKNEVLDASEEEIEVQEIVNLELLFKESRLSDTVVQSDTKVRLKFAGRLFSRSYLPPGASVGWAKEAVTRDLARSLTTRLDMHTDSLEQAETDEKETKMVHEPPRRVFVSVAGTGVTVSDYLYPGEGMEDCVNNVKEIFGLEVQEEEVEDDLEIVASPREMRPPAPPVKGLERRRRIPTGVAVSVGMAMISVGLAWLTLGSSEPVL